MTVTAVSLQREDCVIFPFLLDGIEVESQCLKSEKLGSRPGFVICWLNVLGQVV